MSTITLTIETENETVRITQTVERRGIESALDAVAGLERAARTAWAEDVVAPGAEIAWRRYR